MKSYNIFVGGYGSKAEEAIHYVRFDPKHQSFKKLGAITGIDAPSFLALHPKQNYLYAISEVEEGELVSYQVGDQLSETSREKTGGSGPCFLHVTDDGLYSIVTNYGDGKVSLHPIEDDGKVSQHTDLHLLKETDEASHAHMCYPLGYDQLYIVTDLGQDTIFLFRLQPQHQQLVLQRSFPLKKGFGPRHIEVDQTKNYLYIANEFSSMITVYHYNEPFSELQLIQEISTIPSSEQKDNFCADIHFSPDKTRLFVSNRGRDSIVVYRVQEDGCLSFVDEATTLGEWPRHFALSSDADYLFIANQHSDRLSVLRVHSDGKLQELACHYELASPACVVMFDRE
ncbi:lactonase family protein [Gracilibacillus caseinilyticus]|uniref:Lactonase family protein n=1 Tax=Gracilibacillus caseinilyticus TaxID=2932256 RepID=A0ABY4EQJ3_9BACI|nr:lactonase family protein [Gracilibacillus caseinilyticus]UOQ46718.1 lactonase family protein [Gracilibacillus caseinilyticus]